MEKSEKVILLSNIVLVGFVIAVIFHYILGFYLRLGEPFDSFLCNMQLFFADFKNILYYIKDFSPYNDAPTLWINYFPLAYILLFPFTWIKNESAALLLYLSIFLSFFIYMNIKFLKCSNLSKLENFQIISILVLTSYPLLTLLISGNFDMFLLILITFFVYSFKAKKYLLAVILLAIANAIKPFFWIFIFLFVFEKKWKELFLILALTVFLILGGFMAIKGGFFNQIHGYLLNLKSFKINFIYDPRPSIMGSSDMFLALRFLLCKVNQVISCALFIKVYAIMSFCVAVITLFFAWKERVFWKKIALMTFYFLSMSYVILDYKLIFIFIPLWLFVNAEKKSKFDFIYTILFGLLLIPKKYLIIGFFKIIVFSKIFNPLLMLIFMGLIIFEQIQPKREVKKVVD